MPASASVTVGFIVLVIERGLQDPKASVRIHFRSSPTNRQVGPELFLLDIQRKKLKPREVCGVPEADIPRS